MLQPTHALSLAAAGLLALAACGGEGEDTRPLPLMPPAVSTGTGTSATGSGGSNGTTSSGATMAATTGVEECGPWPSGAPGLEEGEIMPERSWTGIRPGGMAEEQFDLAEFRKCGGGGIDVLIIDTSSYT